VITQREPQKETPRAKPTSRLAPEGAGAGVRRTRGSKDAKRELRFRDLVEPALEAKKELLKNEPSSIKTDRDRLRRILPAIGHLTLRALTAGRIARFLQDLGRGDESHRSLAGATVNRFHSLLSSIWKYAMRQGLTDVNPFAGSSIPWAKEAAIHIRFLERDEQRRLVAVLRKDAPNKVLELELAILTGMRRGEQFGARWEDWKVHEGVLYVKGKTGPREVRINRAARHCLTRLRKRAPKGQIYLTPERNQGPLDRRFWFEKAVKRAELRPRFRYHDLRHTYCSRLVAAGVPLLEVQKLAGHKSFQTTLRYAHLSPDHLRRAAEKVEF
jgi:site-specific recombinase XerD